MAIQIYYFSIENKQFLLTIMDQMIFFENAVFASRSKSEQTVSELLKYSCLWIMMKIFKRCLTKQ